MRTDERNEGPGSEIQVPEKGDASDTSREKEGKLPKREAQRRSWRVIQNEKKENLPKRSGR